MEDGEERWVRKQPLSPASAYAIQLKSHKSPGNFTFLEEESKGSEG